MIPGGADDFFQVRKRSVICNYQWYSAGSGFLLVGHEVTPVEGGCFADGFCDVVFIVSSV